MSNQGQGGGGNSGPGGGQSGGNPGQGGGGSNPGQGGGPGGDNPGQGGGQDHGVKIRIDREDFTVTAASLTGAQLRALPNPDIGADRDLFEVVPGGSDKKIELADRVEMRNGLRFFTAPAQINPGQE